MEYTVKKDYSKKNEDKILTILESRKYILMKNLYKNYGGAGNPKYNDRKLKSNYYDNHQSWNVSYAAFTTLVKKLEGEEKLFKHKLNGSSGTIILSIKSKLTKNDISKC